jgi:galactose mutarotase-like enzyme
MITLQNDTLTAVIHPKGAELQSLQHTNGIEYMWSGNPAFWGKHSPVLFPIVGTLKNDTYTYNQKEYHLPRHGFARDKVFTVEQLGPTEALFILSHDEHTLEVFPFPFTLQLRYRIDGNMLTCTYEVINTGTGDLYFSVGGHPAFALPLTAQASYTDYYLQFNTNEPIQRHLLQDGLIGNETETVSSDKGKVAVHPSLFYQDAMVMKHLKSSAVTLVTTKDSHGLTFNFAGFPFLGIWAAKDAPFICIEPWCGIADSLTHNQQLAEKEGIIKLAASSEWKKAWSVTCF